MDTDLIRTGGLVHPAGVLIVSLSFSLVCHPIGLVHWRHVVAQRNCLHCLVYSAAHGFTHFGGQGKPLHGRWVLRLLIKKEGGIKSYCRKKRR